MMDSDGRIICTERPPSRTEPEIVSRDANDSAIRKFEPGLYITAKGLKFRLFGPFRDFRELNDHLALWDMRGDKAIVTGVYPHDHQDLQWVFESIKWLRRPADDRVDCPGTT